MTLPSSSADTSQLSWGISEREERKVTVPTSFRLSSVPKTGLSAASGLSGAGSSRRMLFSHDRSGAGVSSGSGSSGAAGSGAGSVSTGSSVPEGCS